MCVNWLEHPDYKKKKVYDDTIFGPSIATFIGLFLICYDIFLNSCIVSGGKYSSFSRGKHNYLINKPDIPLVYRHILTNFQIEQSD